MISTKNLFKNYGTKSVVKNVSVDLPKGKIIGFIGPNGAGKSTILSIISRTLENSKGDVIIDDKNLKDWDTRDLSKRLSILKQNNDLNIRLTIRELVEFGRFPYSQGKLTKEDIEFVDKAIDYMNLKELENRYLDELSGGQRQMAFIAMVIAQDTEYIFLDEPLNNLDMNHSVKIMKILRELVDKHNKTVMVVIHDINFVANYADYIIAMKDGEVVSAGSREEIINNRELKKIYNMEIDVENVNGKNICLYYC